MQPTKPRNILGLVTIRGYNPASVDHAPTFRPAEIATPLRPAPMVRLDEPMATFTTMGVGGRARCLVEVTDESQLPAALDHADERSWPVLILGGGSNVLVADGGFPGLVIRMALRGARFTEGVGRGVVTAAAGESWDTLVRACVLRNLAGFECMSGIPGTVGATPIQNVGAYGQEVGQTIESVRVLDRSNRAIVVLSGFDCAFAYRSSIFNGPLLNRYVVLSVTFRLTPGGAPRLEYADLKNAFSKSPEAPLLVEVRDAILRIRARKGMLLSRVDPDHRSAGSFFKNQILDQSTVRRVEEHARRAGRLAPRESLPLIPVGPDRMKLSAAWLLERAGFAKGYRLGRVGISSRHALVLINRGGATAGEVVDLMHRIQDEVRTGFGVELAPEPVLIGFEPPVQGGAVDRAAAA